MSAKIETKKSIQDKLNQALVLHTAGKLKKAENLYKQILAMEPRHADARHLLGVVAMQAGQHEVAIRLIDQALKISKNNPFFYNNMGLAHFGLARVDKARQWFEKALLMKPDYPDALNNLGMIFQQTGELTKATSCFKKALRQNPDSPDAYCNLAGAARQRGLFEDAQKYYRKALILKPDFAIAQCGLASTLLHQCKLDELENIARQIEENSSAFVGSTNYLAQINLLYMAPFLGLPRKLTTRVTAKVERRLLAQKKEYDFQQIRQPSKLRIGYVSPAFGDHSVGHLVHNLFASHDKTRFHIICYSLKNLDTEKSQFAKNLISGCDEYVDLSHFNNCQAADRIAKDQIHVLVDLAGYSPGSRPEIFAQRPAPIQVLWLGHAQGSGLSCHDYLLADQAVIPPKMEKSYAEKIVRLPGSFLPLTGSSIDTNQMTKRDQGLGESSFVFCCFNNPQKINQRVFSVWMRILNRVPGSQLWLQNPANSSGLVTNLRNFAAQAKVSPERIVFAGRVADKQKHLTRLSLADLYLDTFGVNGACTSIDALNAGVVLLCVSGRYFPARISASIMADIGMTPLVCKNASEYEKRAVLLAKNPEKLAKWKQKLGIQWQKNTRTASKKLPKNLETAFFTMWKKYCANKPPENFDIGQKPAKKT